MIDDLYSPRPLRARPGAATVKGRGVFAVGDIATGELADVATCIELDAHGCDRVLGTPLDDYYFRHPGNADHGLLVLGLASLCNHSEAPNTDTTYRHDPACGWIVLLTATRPIRSGEEITRRYACAPWFQAAT